MRTSDSRRCFCSAAALSRPLPDPAAAAAAPLPLLLPPAPEPAPLPRDALAGLRPGHDAARLAAPLPAPAPAPAAGLAGDAEAMCVPGGTGSLLCDSRSSCERTDPSRAGAAVRCGSADGTAGICDHYRQ